MGERMKIKVDPRYIEERNKFIPEAENHANMVCMEFGEDGQHLDPNPDRWNLEFHTKMNDLSRHLLGRGTE
jgi:hypothetical protein